MIQNKPGNIREETRKKYADIIDLERPVDEEVFRRHPRMSVANRAKIFAPFAALRGHGERLEQENEKLNLVEKITLSEEESERLSEKIAQVKKGMLITITCFQAESDSDLGQYKDLTGTVTLFDPVYRHIRLDETMISFSDILDISGKEIVDRNEM
ncbi:MAG: YolD-like family protein [Clostridiales bacterium]|nr:YolD-like family protein [Clostridiales bacterium]